MWLRAWLFSLLLCTVTQAQQQAVPINDNSVETLKRLAQLQDRRFDDLFVMAVGLVDFDSAGTSIETVTVVDSLGDTVYFASAEEFYVFMNPRISWKTGAAVTVGNVYYALPISQFEFEARRNGFNTQWDTVSYLAIGRGRRR